MTDELEPISEEEEREHYLSQTLQLVATSDVAYVAGRSMFQENRRAVFLAVGKDVIDVCSEEEVKDRLYELLCEGMAGEATADQHGP